MSFRLWNTALESLSMGRGVAWLQVIQSVGSSPGRAGFRMIVDSQGRMEGSIGGGIMEHKLVELSREMLRGGTFAPLIRRQIHQSNIGESRSGMICSGEQTIAFYHLSPGDAALLHAAKSGAGSLVMDEHGIRHVPEILEAGAEIHSEQAWSYAEPLGHRHHLHVVGGGHVGYAFTRLMGELDFRIHLYDNREGLNTFEANHHVHEKHLVDYPDIGVHIPSGPEVYVVVMTFGYRTDEEVLRQLIGRPFRYLGVMGSVAKMRKMWEDLMRDGYPEEDLQKVHTPAGIAIHSKTPEEIAISIAAEIIRIKNEPWN